MLKEHATMFLEEIVLKLCRNDVEGFVASSNRHDQEVRETLEENSFYSRRKNFMPTLKTGDTVVGLKFKQNSIEENHIKNPNEIHSSHRKPLKRTLSIRQQATQGVWGKYSRIRALATRNFLTLIRSPM
jgi:hypothetical protein